MFIKDYVVTYDGRLRQLINRPRNKVIKQIDMDVQKKKEKVDPIDNKMLMIVVFIWNTIVMRFMKGKFTVLELLQLARDKAIGVERV